MKKTKNQEFFSRIRTNLFSKFVLILIFFLSLVSIARAQVVINEIMYSLEGADSGREWVEIFNKGDKSVDISGWRFFEAKTNHKINLIDGENNDFIFPPNSFAIIVDNYEKFSKDYPNFSGLVFDSSFSLSNKGEKIILRNSNLDNVDGVSYLPDWGADGNSDSLQLIDEKWKEGVPTVGEANSSFIGNSSLHKTYFSNSQTSVDSKVSRFGAIESENYANFNNYKIYANAGDDKIVVVGSPTEFRGRSLGLKKEPLLKARYLWTFGDGSISKGQNLFHFYSYPGEYVVVLDVSSGEYTASDRILVKVVPANILISQVDLKNNFVELFNQSKYELDLSGWKICSGLKCFVLPKNTIILPNKKLIFSYQITGLNIFDVSQVFLEYPNGEVLNKYEKKLPLLKTGEIKTIQNKVIFKTRVSNSKKTSGLGFRSAGENHKSIGSGKKIIQKKVTDQLALVGGVNQKDKNNSLFNKWIFSLFGIILVSIVGFLFVSKLDSNLEDKEKLDDFEDGQNSLTPEDFNIVE